MRPHLPLTRMVPLAAAALVAVGLAACSSSSPPSGAEQERGRGRSTRPPRRRPSTAQETGFSPYTPQGATALGLQVTQKASGRGTSPGVAGSASYRCTAQPGAVAYDPCFAPPLATKGPLLCVPDPTDRDVTQFSVDTLPTTSASTPPKQVWAMQLQNGEMCILVRGTWRNGLGPFACPTPAATSSQADCHAPEYAVHGWSTACQTKQDASSPFSAVSVVTVWN